MGKEVVAVGAKKDAVHCIEDGRGLKVLKARQGIHIYSFFFFFSFFLLCTPPSPTDDQRPMFLLLYINNDAMLCRTRRKASVCVVTSSIRSDSVDSCRLDGGSG